MEGDLDATRKLRDIYILLVSTLRTPRRQTASTNRIDISMPRKRKSSMPSTGTMSSQFLEYRRLFPNPEDLTGAFQTVKDAMVQLQPRLWVEFYHIVLSHREGGEVCAMFSMAL